MPSSIVEVGTGFCGGVAGDWGLPLGAGAEARLATSHSSETSSPACLQPTGANYHRL